MASQAGAVDRLIQYPRFSLTTIFDFVPVDM